MRSFFILITAACQWLFFGFLEICKPFLLHVPSGKLSGPTLKPVRCFFGCEEAASSSRGLLGAISTSLEFSLTFPNNPSRSCRRCCRRCMRVGVKSPSPKNLQGFRRICPLARVNRGSDSGSDYSACSVTTSASHSTLEKTNHIISLCKVFPSFFDISSYHSFLDFKSANFQPLPYICTISFLLS